jgi:hypothetical protein
MMVGETLDRCMCSGNPEGKESERESEREREREREILCEDIRQGMYRRDSPGGFSSMIS